LLSHVHHHIPTAIKLQISLDQQLQTPLPEKTKPTHKQTNKQTTTTTPQQLKKAKDCSRRRSRKEEEEEQQELF
jgi:hypothetical protein